MDARHHQNLECRSTPNMRQERSNTNANSATPRHHGLPESRSSVFNFSRLRPKRSLGIRTNPVGRESATSDPEAFTFEQRKRILINTGIDIDPRPSRNRPSSTPNNASVASPASLARDRSIARTGQTAEAVNNGSQYRGTASRERYEALMQVAPWLSTHHEQLPGLRTGTRRTTLSPSTPSDLVARQNNARREFPARRLPSSTSFHPLGTSQRRLTYQRQPDLLREPFALEQREGSSTTLASANRVRESEDSSTLSRPATPFSFQFSSSSTKFSTSSSNMRNAYPLVVLELGQGWGAGSLVDGVGRIWAHTPRAISRMHVDTCTPVNFYRFVEEDTIPPSLLEPLCDFRGLRELKITGMLDSYQSIIWQAAWLCPQLESLTLEMVLPPEAEPIRQLAWRAIEPGWTPRPLPLRRTY